MTERWEREIGKLGSVEAPSRVRTRFEQGPVGDGGDPLPRPRQRIIVGIVAFAVFTLAIALSAGAFSGQEPAPVPGGPNTPEPPFDDIAVVSIQRDPLRIFLTYADQRQEGDIRDTWKPSGDPYDERPTCDSGTLGDTLLVVPPSTEFSLEGDRLRGWTVFPQPASDPTHLPDTDGPVEWTLRGGWSDLEFDACFSLFVGEPGATVPVPDVVDFLDQGAYRELGAAGLLWDVVLEDAPDQKQWRVLRTEPPAGDAVAPNTVVRLVISTEITPPPDFAAGDEEWACPIDERIPFGGPHYVTLPSGEAYVRQIGGYLQGDRILLGMLIQGRPWDVWHWLRDGKLVAIVDYGTLDGIACRGSGIAGA